MPAYVASQSRAHRSTALDLVAAALFLLLLVGETIADQQQWRFQAPSRHEARAASAVSQDFVSTGLFRYSRHPNFFCEQAMWWSFYGFAVAARALARLVDRRRGDADPAVSGLDAADGALSVRKYPAYATTSGPRRCSCRGCCGDHRGAAAPAIPSRRHRRESAAARRMSPVFGRARRCTGARPSRARVSKKAQSSMASSSWRMPG